MRRTVVIPALSAAFFCLIPLAPAHAAHPSARQTSTPARSVASGLIDINQCSADQLITIPGMTRVWANRIVRFRPYRTKADLEDQGILPADLYDRIKDSIIAHRPKQ